VPKHMMCAALPQTPPRERDPLRSMTMRGLASWSQSRRQSYLQAVHHCFVVLFAWHWLAWS